MSFISKNNPIAIGLRILIAKISNKPAVSALEEYESSDLKKIVDAVAEFAEVTRDENGSFEASFKNQNEDLKFIFQRAADPSIDMKGFSINLEAHYHAKVETEHSGWKMTRTINENPTVNYHLHGKNINFIAVKLPFVGAASLMPNEMVPHILDALQNGSPTVCEEVVKRTGLTPPPKQPDILQQFGL